MVEKYRDKAKMWGEGAALVELASKVLAEELGPHAGHASVDWDRSTDERGQPVYTVTLRDSPDEARALLLADDFQNPTLLQLRLSSVVRALLRVKTDRMWREYREANDLEA